MNARSRRKIPKRQWPPAEGAVSLSKTTLLLARPRQGQPLVRAEPAAARERLRVVVRAAPGRERQRILPGACGSSFYRRAVGPPDTAGGGAARCASPHGRSRPIAGDWLRHVRVGRHRPRRLLAPLSAADRSHVRLSHLCAPRPRLIPFRFSGSARVRCNWPGPTGTHNGLRCEGKKTPAQRGKKNLCV